ncbi:hypothetical protein [Alteromonas facilis]|uniref:hypothetical protein n=1 Tax=Alteromonas facilis TaxID=2048004 RepID=UPI000C28F1B4|nr:hypothetical protein [Alteromonas facilis]
MNELFTIKSSQLWASLSSVVTRSLMSEEQASNAERFMERCKKNNWVFETLSDGESIRVMSY